MSADPLLTVPQALEQIRAGRMVIVVDDEDRENEGDLTMAGDLVTADAVNFMARQGRGLICLALTEERVDELGLPMMTAENRSPRGTAFTVSVDARRGVTTGISARERAETCRVLVDPRTRPEDLVTPGHIFPLRARRGGVLVRSGHTEAAIDLSRLAGCAPAGLICEIMRDDGEMARLPDLESFAAEHGLGIVRIADLIQYRLSKELLVERVSQGVVRPRGSNVDYQAYVYTTAVEETEYLALVLGQPTPDDPVLVRVQTASALRDVFGVGQAHDNLGPRAWLRSIEQAGKGVLLYVLPRAPRGLRTDFETRVGGLSAAAALAKTGGDVSAPLRDFGLGAQVLSHLGVRAIRLLTDNPRRIAALEGYGIQVVECVPSQPPGRLVAIREESSK